MELGDFNGRFDSSSDAGSMVSWWAHPSTYYTSLSNLGPVRSRSSSSSAGSIHPEIFADPREESRVARERRETGELELASQNDDDPDMIEEAVTGSNANEVENDDREDEDEEEGDMTGAGLPASATITSTSINPSLSSSDGEAGNGEEMSDLAQADQPAERASRLVRLRWPVRSPIHGEDDEEPNEIGALTMEGNGRKGGTGGTIIADTKEAEDVSLPAFKIKKKGDPGPATAQAGKRRMKDFLGKTFYHSVPSPGDLETSPEEQPEARKATPSRYSNHHNNRIGGSYYVNRGASGSSASSVASSERHRSSTLSEGEEEPDEKINIVIMAPSPSFATEEEVHSPRQPEEEASRALASGDSVPGKTNTGVVVTAAASTEGKESAPVAPAGEGTLSSTDNNMIDYTTGEGISFPGSRSPNGNSSQSMVEESAEDNNNRSGEAGASSQSAPKITTNELRAISGRERNDFRIQSDPTSHLQTQQKTFAQKNGSKFDPARRESQSPPPQSIITNPRTISQMTGEDEEKGNVMMGRKDGFHNDLESESTTSSSFAEDSQDVNGSKSEKVDFSQSSLPPRFSPDDEQEGGRRMMMRTTISTGNAKAPTSPADPTTFTFDDEDDSNALEKASSSLPPVIDAIFRGGTESTGDVGRDSSLLSGSSAGKTENRIEDHVTGGIELGASAHSTSAATGIMTMTTPATARQLAVVLLTTTASPELTGAGRTTAVMEQPHVHKSNWGGVCECYCPCLNSAESDYEDDANEDVGILNHFLVSTPPSDLPSEELGSGSGAFSESNFFVEEEEELFTGSGSSEMAGGSGILEDVIFIEEYFGSGSGSGSGETPFQPDSLDKEVGAMEETNTIPVFPSSSPRRQITRNNNSNSLEDPVHPNPFPNGFHNATNFFNLSAPVLISKYSCHCPGFTIEQRTQTSGNTSHFMLIFPSPQDGHLAEHEESDGGNKCQHCKTQNKKKRREIKKRTPCIQAKRPLPLVLLLSGAKIKSVPVIAS